MKKEASPPPPGAVRDVMSSPVVTVPVDAPVKLVVELMFERGVSALPVVDALGRVAGIISEADLLLKETASPSGAAVPWLETAHTRDVRRKQHAATAADLMTSPVLTVSPATRLGEAAKLMVQKRVKRLPVVEGTSIVGIVTRRDLLRVYLVPDDQLRRRVLANLHAWLGSDASGVHVAVHGGVVMVSGLIATRSGADIVGRLVTRLDGVLSMENGLVWRVDDRLAAEIRHAVHV